MKKGKWVLLLAALLLFRYVAAAETLVLPAELTEVQEEAFAGDTALTGVDIPEKVEVIGDRAFSGCAKLGWVRIPAGTESIGEDAFAGCAEDLLIRTTPGSAACAYARGHQIDYQASTVYRALLIAQTYSDISSLELDGPENDVIALGKALKGFAGTPYDIFTRMNQTADEIIACVGSAFGSATENDVSLFYYSGHGASVSDGAVQGSLVGKDGKTFVSPDQLREALDRIPGRKIVIIDACYSGGMLTSKNLSGGKDDREKAAEAFGAAFISAFSRKARGNLASDGYFVLTAASAEELCYEQDVNGLSRGLFTYSITEGLGYDSKQAGAMPADVNDNRVITFQELYQYSREQTAPKNQHVQVYPENCTWFGVARADQWPDTVAAVG